MENRPSAHDPLLPSHVSDDNISFGNKKRSLFASSSLKCVLKISMWVLFTAWVTILFFYPSDSATDLIVQITKDSHNTSFGSTGTLLLIVNGPFFLLVFLGIVYLSIKCRDEEEEEEELQHYVKKGSPKKRIYCLRTFPIFVDGPLGVVSAAEFIGILLFIIFIAWTTSIYSVQKIATVFQSDDYTLAEKWSSAIEFVGNALALSGILCMSFLFLPVTRGSVVFRLINIPPEHAVRYHRWLGNAVMCLFTLHGLLYVLAWAGDGSLMQQIFAWADTDGANFAGVISLIAGLIMWVTSTSTARTKYFELFFCTHHLYVIFIIFMALHVGNATFTLPAGGIFLFALDRFLRFWQSRRKVDVISARCLPSGILELVLAKPKSLRYNALSFIFLKVSELSRLQWHPFSISSSPLDGNRHLSILIKDVGDWTSELKAKILEMTTPEPEKSLLFQQSSKISVSVEGPYGHEWPYHLMYTNLILVAGGIGISPFLAILKDISNRIRQGKNCLPRNIMVVWAIKNPNELSLLSSSNIESTCQSLSDELNLEILVHITRGSQTDVQENNWLREDAVRPSTCVVAGSSKGSGGVSLPVNTATNSYFGVCIISSTIGFLGFILLVNKFYVIPFEISNWWYGALLLVACMVGSVLVFGGAVIGLWYIWETRTTSQQGLEVGGENANLVLPNSEDLLEERFVNSTTTLRYGSRPDFKEIFGSTLERWGSVDVAVIVCGPPTLQSSVARECRSLTLSRQPQHPNFHFYSHSFSF